MSQWHKLAAQIQKKSGVKFERLLRAGIQPQGEAAPDVDELLENHAFLLDRNKIFVPETYFFRHPEQFVWLARFAQRRKQEKKPLRVLSLGCSTGEEVWSVAMILEALNYSPTYSIVEGWDIVPERIVQARSGAYELWSLRENIEPYDSWIIKDHKKVRVHDTLHKRVRFRVANIFDVDSSRADTDAWDVILCRNVSIYWTDEAKARAIGLIESMLRPGGIAIFGPSDSFATFDNVMFDADINANILPKRNQSIRLPILR